MQKRQASQEELEQATKLKKKAVRDGKQNTFRHQIHELASSSKFWKLAKWGRSKANKTSDLPLVPDLETQEGIAKTFEEKTKAFSQQFFPKALVPEPGSESSQTISEIQLSQEVTCEEVEQILAKKKPFTAGGRDKLPNGFLRALGSRFLLRPRRNTVFIYSQEAADRILDRSTRQRDTGTSHMTGKTNRRVLAAVCICTNK